MHSVSSTWRRAAFAAACCLLWDLPSRAHEFKFKSLTIEHPYVFEPDERLPKSLPLFMTIKNEGSEADRLVGAESPFAGSAKIVVQSASGLNAAGQGIALPAAGETTLRKSGSYVLLQDMKEPLDGYLYFPLTLIFEKAGKVEIEVYVEEHQ